MATIGSLVVDLKAETAAFRRDLGRARRDVNRFASQTNRSLGTINQGFANLGRSAKGFLAVFAATAGVRGLDQTLASLSEIANTADKLGLTAEALQGLRVAAEQNDIPINRLDTAMQRFTRRIGEARLGSGELAGTLRQYGIAVTDADGRTRDTTDVLGDLADVVQQADSDTERLRISFKAFDSEGASLVNILRRGSAGLDGWTQGAVDAGAVMDDELIDKAREINREWVLLTRVIGTQAKAAIVQFAVVLREAFTGEALARRAGEIREELQRINDDLVATFDTLDAAQRRNRGGAFQGLVDSLQRQLDDLKDARTQLRQERQALESDAAIEPPGGAPVDTAARDRIAGVTAELRFQAEQIARTNEVQRVYVELRRAGIEADSAAGREIRNLVERLQEGEREQAEAAEAAEMLAQSQRAYQDAVADAARATEDGMRTIRSSSEQALGGMARDLLDGGNAMDSLANAARSTVNAIISEFLRLAVVRPIIGSIFGAAGAGAGATSVTQATAPGGTGLLFAHGGSFIADGPGGTDAIAQRINVTKGERVTVETPAQQRAGRGGGDTFIIDARGADRGGLARLEALIESLHGSIERRAVGAIVDERARNPALFNAGF